MPSFTSGSANSLRVVASLMSQDSASSRPTPKQYPSTAAMTGFGLRAAAVTLCPRSVKSTGSTSMKPAMSPPEEKCFPADLITTTRTAGSASMSANRSAIRWRISQVITV
jgi:hypothetical protein